MDDEVEILAEEDPAPLVWEWKPPYHKSVWAIVKCFGWYVVAICIVMIYTWPFISKKFKSWKRKKDEMEYDAKYHKDVDRGSQLLLGIQLAREKQQEQYLRHREIELQKEEEKKERKRQELLRLQEELPGHRLNENQSKSDGSSSSKSKLKGDYNPLMGGSSTRYVPPKRSCCKKGGGCG